MEHKLKRSQNPRRPQGSATLDNSTGYGLTRTTISHTPDEAVMLKSAAKEEGLTLSRWLIDVALTFVSNPVVKDLAKKSGITEFEYVRALIQHACKNNWVIEKIYKVTSEEPK